MQGATLTVAPALAPSQRRRDVPSGWTPLELVKHLTFVELPWLD